jgi:hypothetical protein
VQEAQTLSDVAVQPADWYVPDAQGTVLQAVQ